MPARKRGGTHSRSLQLMPFDYSFTLPNGTSLTVQLTAEQVGDILKHENPKTGKKEKSKPGAAAPVDELDDFMRNGLGDDTNRFNFISRMYEGDAIRIHRADGKLKDVFESALCDYRDKKPELMAIVDECVPLLKARQRKSGKPAGVSGVGEDLPDEIELEREEGPKSKLEMVDIEPVVPPKSKRRSA